MQPHDQITGPPAHDAIDRRDRPFLHETNKKRLVLLGEFAGRKLRPDFRHEGGKVFLNASMASAFCL